MNIVELLIYASAKRLMWRHELVNSFRFDPAVLDAANHLILRGDWRFLHDESSPNLGAKLPITFTVN